MLVKSLYTAESSPEGIPGPSPGVLRLRDPEPEELSSCRFLQRGAFYGDRVFKAARVFHLLVRCPAAFLGCVLEAMVSLSTLCLWFYVRVSWIAWWGTCEEVLDSP
jgi:hypothetical protein